MRPVEAPWLSQLDVASHLGGWSWDFKDNCIAATKGLFDLFDFDVPDGKRRVINWLKRVDTLDRASVRRAFRRFISHGEDMDTIFRVGVEDSERWVRLLGHMRREESGGPLFASGVLIDVTYERTLAEETISEVSRRQRRISYDLTDELAQQLSGILIRTETLLEDLGEGVDDQAARMRLSEVINSVREAQGFTRRLSNTAVPVLVSKEELESKLQTLARLTCDREEASCSFSLETDDLHELDEFEATQVYRMAEDGLSFLCSRREVADVHISLAQSDEKFVLDFAISSELDEEELESSPHFDELKKRATLLGGSTSVRHEDPALIRCLF